jgi:60 kDa SS-A/Ro ribonucleoprotein
MWPSSRPLLTVSAGPEHRSVVHASVVWNLDVSTVLKRALEPLSGFGKRWCIVPNKSLFKVPSFRVPVADTTNHAGGKAYSLSSEHALAQFAFTGCFNSTFYTSAEKQLETVLRLAEEVRPELLAKIAIAAHEQGYMKDVPAFLLAVLARKNTELFSKAFPRIVTNGKMLCTYAQMALSGATGKVFNLSAGAHRRAIQNWFDSRKPETIFRQNIGNEPSLVAVLRLAHVKPKTKDKEALLTYLFNTEFGWKHEKGTRHGATASDLPELVQQYEAFKKDMDEVPVPAVDFRQLDGLGLTTYHWAEVFRNANWYMTRMNLNTAARQGVFKFDGMTEMIANRLRDREAIKAAGAFPYQIYTAYLNSKKNVPHEVAEALQDAAEIALENVPSLGRVVVFVDVSASMKNPVTGKRAGYGSYQTHHDTSTDVRCVDVAALVASGILRANRSARVLPFSYDVIPTELNSRDSIMTNTNKLAGLLGGGTNCSAPLALLNKEDYKFDTAIFLSDNESWVDTANHWNSGNGTKTHEQWLIAKKKNPNAKLVCVDLQPNTTTQVKERQDILQVSGFSDNVFKVMAAFKEGGNSQDFWAKLLDKVEV